MTDLSHSESEERTTKKLPFRKKLYAKWRYSHHRIRILFHEYGMPIVQYAVERYAPTALVICYFILAITFFYMCTFGLIDSAAGPPQQSNEYNESGHRTPYGYPHSLDSP